MQEKGNLSINSENFMPIIKKWLYTDKDIFIRELVSNACDAVTKLQKLSMMGEADIPAEEAYEIHVVLDQDKKTLQIIDNGIGMTADEIKKYINQIAFSGATDFLSKFEGKTEDEGSEIIGHFGLGFYSAFMVADTVEIDSLSYQKGAEPAKWRCNGGIDYEMEAGERTERGTTITLFIGADGEEFLNEATLYAAMRKYCAFMPVPIFVDVLKEETEEEKAAAKKAENTVHVSPEEAAKLTTEGAMDLLQEQQDAAEEAKAEEPKPLNDTNPLWQRKPSECTDEDYKAFYHQVFNDLNDPLFWIHLNMDYPFRLKGILYFPKLVEQMDMMDEWEMQKADESFYTTVETSKTFFGIYESLRKYLALYLRLRENFSGTQSSLIRQVNSYIHKNYNQNISLQTIADTFLVSCGHLSRLYRKETGVSLISAINNRRIEVAKRLLKDPRNRVFEVARAVGIEEPTYFTHLFTQVTGVSPSAYRKQLESLGGHPL